MTANSTKDQWLQYYEHHQIPAYSVSDTTSATTTVITSSSPSGGSPKPALASGKRSRASRRTIPTTLLNANPSNFRALVQQFTGYSSTNNSVRRKGLITLNFGSASSNEDIIQDVNHTNRSHIYDSAVCHQKLSQHEGGERKEYYYQPQTMSYQMDRGSAVSFNDFVGSDDHAVSGVSTNSYSRDMGEHHDMEMVEGLMDDLHTLLSK